MGKFRDLKVWQKAVDVAVDIYKITKVGAIAKDFKVDRRTLVKLIEPIQEKLSYKQEKRRILSPKEVQIIYDYLGVPV